MEKRQLGKTGMAVSVLGFGGAEIGFEGASKKDVSDLFAKALDLGLNAIDTAECYANSEELIGEAIGARRKDFYLFTKCGHKDGFKDAWSKEEIAASIDKSLKNLKTDHVDLLQLHSCNKDVLAKGDVVEALKKAQSEGKCRFIGYSGDGLDARYALEMGVFDTLQTSVNIFDQECIELTLPLAVKHGVGVIAKRPIGNAVWRHHVKPDNTYVHEYYDRMKALDYDFLSNGNEGRAGEIALRFTLGQPAVSTMIVGTKNPDRWQANADLVSKGILPEDEMAKIRAAWHRVAKADWVGQV